MRKKTLLLALLLFFALNFVFFPPTVSAETDGSFNSYFEFLQQEILRLQGILLDLQKQLFELQILSRFQYPPLERALERGMTGEDVRYLQEFLKEDPTIYPEGLVTGFFGPLTEAAIIRFQERNGLVPNGIFDFQTREKINNFISVREEVEEELFSNNVLDVTFLPESISEVIEEAEPKHAQYFIHPRPDYDTSAISLMVHDAVNKARVERGIQQLYWNSDLARVALMHSEDQAVDNARLIDTDKPCAYPILRHEGFNFGLTVGERIKNEGIRFKVAGENLVLFSGFKTLVFVYNPDKETVQICPQVKALDLDSVSTKEEKYALLREGIETREALLNKIKPVEWINKEWQTQQEAAEMAVDLWLNSDGHRENMLNPIFKESGVGISLVDDYFIITHVLTAN